MLVAQPQFQTDSDSCSPFQLQPSVRPELLLPNESRAPFRYSLISASSLLMRFKAAALALLIVPAPAQHKRRRGARTTRADEGDASMRQGKAREGRASGKARESWRGAAKWDRSRPGGAFCWLFSREEGASTEKIGVNSAPERQIDTRHTPER